jgi:DNA-nicking Smr family endonuclease
MPRPRRVATEAERALWGTVTRDVRPLGAIAMWQPEAPPPEPVQPPEIDSKPPAEAKPRTPGPVDRGTLGRLKSGQVEIDARIDLHGMDQRAAFAALMGFVDVSVRTGRRALLVITGKGSAASGGGILRRSAPDWLNASPFAQRILAMAPAHVRHGGAGAFYVLLRRRRSSSDLSR